MRSAPNDLEAMIAEFTNDKIPFVVKGDADGMVELAAAAREHVRPLGRWHDDASVRRSSSVVQRWSERDTCRRRNPFLIDT